MSQKTAQDLKESGNAETIGLMLPRISDKVQFKF